MAEDDFIVQGLKLTQKLGGGAFGSVHLGEGQRWSYGKSKYVRDKFAVKKISKGDGTTLTEIEVHNYLGRHPNITYLYDWMETPPDGDTKRIWLVYEYCDSGSLNALLLKEALPLNKILDYCLDITSALLYMHEHRIVHLDIKADNILLAKSKHGFAAKICDFGISRILDPTGKNSHKVTNLTRSCGPWYTSAPEVFVRDSRLTDKSDIFSLGGLILGFFTRTPVRARKDLQLVTPHFVLENGKVMALHEASQNSIYRLVEQSAPRDFYDLLCQMLNIDYHKRPFCEAVLTNLKGLEQAHAPQFEMKGLRRAGTKRLRDNESIISGGEEAVALETSKFLMKQRRSVRQIRGGKQLDTSSEASATKKPPRKTSQETPRPPSHEGRGIRRVSQPDVGMVRTDQRQRRFSSDVQVKQDRKGAAYSKV